jgi:hypothetical protein
MKFLFLKEYSQIILYFFLFNLAFLSATVILHELGHLYAGQLSGCTGRVVLSDIEMGTYTEIYCDREVNRQFISLGPFMLIIPFSILFLALNIPEKYFFYIVSGQNLSMSALDFVNAFNIDILFFLAIIGGIILILYGEILLTHKWVFTVEGVLVKL